MKKDINIELYSIYDNFKASKTIRCLYNFDKNLKMLILSNILDIEQSFKHVFTINFIERYNHSIEELINDKNYSKSIMTRDILCRVKKQLNDYELSTKEINYYNKKYDCVPLYAYIKSLSFGLMRDLYYISKPNDKDHICKKLTNGNISSKNLETFLEFLVKIRNICCHNEILFSYVSESEMIPNTKYHKEFVVNNIQYGKKDFLAALISIKILSDKKQFSILIKDIDKLINMTCKKINISKKNLLNYMNLPLNYKKVLCK